MMIIGKRLVREKRAYGFAVGNKQTNNSAAIEIRESAYIKKYINKYKTMQNNKTQMYFYLQLEKSFENMLVQLHTYVLYGGNQFITFSFQLFLFGFAFV